MVIILLPLKALMPSFGGRVDLIYIDPPYNTGKENWRYNDNVNSPMHQEWLKQVVNREDLTRHDKWLCMMWPRLVSLKELLKEDGVILVSIDDNEVHHLRGIMDEIFDENFIAQLVWEKGRKNDAKLFSIGHEYMLVYARSLEVLKRKNTVWREPKPGAKEIWEKYLELREKYESDDKAVEDELQEWYKGLPSRHPSKALSRYKHVDKFGPWRDRDISWPGGDGPTYDVIHPVTKKPCKVPDGGWRFATLEAMQQQIDMGLIEFREDHTQPPFRKAHLYPVPEELYEADDLFYDEAEWDVTKVLDNGNGSDEVGLQVMPSVIYKQSQVAVKDLKKLMGSKVFDNPKDHEVIARLIRYITSDNKNAIILDSFAGSGTTGQAVLEVNSEDNGNRRFILIEQEDYANSLTAERIRRVIHGVPISSDAALKDGIPGTFSYFNLGDALEEEALLKGEKLPTYNDLGRYVFFTATGEQLDESKIDEEHWYLGESSNYEVFMLYKPDIDFLKKTPFNLEFVEKIGPAKGKPRLVIASHKYMDDSSLREHRVEFCQLPFAIYKFRA